MSRTAWISLLGAGLLAAHGARAQGGDFLLLDEMTIKGQVKQPAVAIISSRLVPEIQGFKLEKSFFEQVRSPDEELVLLDRRLADQALIRDPQALLARARQMQAAAWPLKGGADAEAGAESEKASGESQSGK
jgi:hypothetical protein